FDAEYLFYKQAGSVLSIGLQTGFDVETGKVTVSNKDYYAGDLALSFDGDNSTYEYAFDFGLYTEDYYGNVLGPDAEGLYKVESFFGFVTGWNNGVYSGHTVSNPFAMASGTLFTGDITNDAGSFGDSYYRMVSFNLDDIYGLDFTGLDVHWTMSCGNDAIDGSAPASVPEPATMVLLGSGLIGLALYRRKIKK
ncbi:MAG: PEP-CTERM sorting domain-containing protein, partial [Desulfuromusa sp.]|nr:PEP-CTERM sorting domain-containing protein [Desulfuromusa sp.]